MRPTTLPPQTAPWFCRRRKLCLALMVVVTASSTSWTVDAVVDARAVHGLFARREPTRTYHHAWMSRALRGGESNTATLLKSPPKESFAESVSDSDAPPVESEADRALRAYRMQQHLYLTSRSLQLRQALIGRGLTELSHSAVTKDKPSFTTVDWECAQSTESHPKSCLYSIDAEEGAKVIAPAVVLVGNKQYQWISVAALNRLRRNDPTKVEPLWHNQYAILSTWFRSDHSYSLASHLPVVGQALSLVLDRPWILTAVLTAAMGVMILAAWPLLEVIASMLLTSRLLWHYYSSWRFLVHAALPLRLLLVQMAFKAIQEAFGSMQSRVKTELVELECRFLQDHLPLTLLEGVNEVNGRSETVGTESSEERKDDNDDDDDDDDDDE